MQKSVLVSVCVGLLASTSAFAGGNVVNDSFLLAKKMLEKQVYFDHRVTLYCGAPFDAQKNVELPVGFSTPSHENRARRIEWEHVVPAENFGRHFEAWRSGDAQCKKGFKRFKGRSCAELVSRPFRLMQADMYNLFPAIGAVNALRSNYRFTQFAANTPSTFGSCTMKIDKRFQMAEPPERARGEAARASLYMAWAYAQHFNLSDAQRKLFEAWDRTYPVTAWECLRAKRIEKLQRNENPFVKESCRKAGMW